MMFLVSYLKNATFLSLLLIVNTTLASGGAFDKVVDDPRLPSVLLIGDSISIDYTPDTRELLKGKANVHRPACNCMFSGNVAANIKNWLGTNKWDVVHFNAGIWDCHFVDKNGNMLQNIDKDYYDANKAVRTSPAQYKDNLNKIIDAIIATGAKPVFATTTTVPRWNDKRRDYLNTLNETATNLMFYKQVPVNDLYSYSLPHLKEWQLPDQVHFNPLGKQRLAEKVSAEILKALGSEDKILEWSPSNIEQSVMYDRTVVRYEHDCLKSWGYEKAQKQFFYVMESKNALYKKPLVVFLHSAGGNAEKELDGNVKRIVSYGDEFVGLILNSPSKLAEPVNGSSEYDWWWGAKAIMKEPEVYKDKMTRVENRVLDTVEWVIQNYNINRNRVYLRGVSMGGSGALGIGLSHGDVFAALQADVFAGVDHALYRLDNVTEDPPYAVLLFSHLDSWSNGAEQLLDLIPEQKLGISYGWDVYGHDHKVHYENSNQAVVRFPWLSIRRNEAYPVFTNTSSNDIYPGYMNREGQQRGQVNAYLRWSVLQDCINSFVIELRQVNRLIFAQNIELKANELQQLKQAITTDVTLRRLQNFEISNDADYVYHWTAENQGRIIASGNIITDSHKLLTIKNVEVGLTPVRLTVMR